MATGDVRHCCVGPRLDRDVLIFGRYVRDVADDMSLFGNLATVIVVLED